nr:response regulator transcription factor [Desulfobulbaceae bacterium]
MSVRKIVLADDHVLIRRGLIKIIDGDPTLKVIGDVNDGLELLSLLKKTCPDLILLDISMPNLRGIEAIKEAKKLCPSVKILILTMHSSRDFLCDTFRNGANGYALKEDSDVELLAAINKCLAGQIYISSVLADGLTPEEIANLGSGKQAVAEEEGLTTREKQVLTLVAEGKKSKDVADLLSISIRTVEHHRANIMKKTQIKNTAALIKYAIQKGYILAQE